MSRIPPDTPEADAQEQEQDWTDDDPERSETGDEVPLDAPEADVLDQKRSAGIDDEERAER